MGAGVHYVSFLFRITESRTDGNLPLKRGVIHDPY
jgi:hypothetical protein